MLPPDKIPHVDSGRQIEHSEALQSHGTVAAPVAQRLDGSTGEIGGAPALATCLWKGKRVITATAICGLVAGLAYGLFTQPFYRARTSLQVEGFNDQALREVTPVSPLPNASAEDYLQNEVKVLESDTLARRVANQLGPISQSRPDALHDLLRRAKNALSSVLPIQAAVPKSAEEQRIHQIRKAITVRTSLQSQVMEVYFDARDPVAAARGANTTTAEFISLNREARSQLVQDTTEWLNKQAVELKAKLEALNHQLQQFTARSGLVLSAGNPPAQERVRELQEAYTHAEADRAAKQAAYEAAAANHGQIMPDSPASASLRQYQTDLQNMRRQLADLSAIYKPNNYRVARLQAQIDETDAAIKKERNEILDRMRGDYLAAASLEKMLSSSLETQLTTAGHQTQKELQYNVVKSELDATQKLYDSVMERAKAAGAASSLRVTNIRVIDPATPPPAPYSPNLALNLAIGLGIGTVGGASLVLIGARSNKVRYPGEMTSAYIPELGVVPSASCDVAIPSLDSAPGTVGQARFDSSLLKESFRAVLTSILFSSRSDHGSEAGTSFAQRRLLVVTSVDIMEGKTTVVTNLGIASAQQSRDVLLIDADLRRPRLHERFGLPNRSGLTDILQHPDLFELLDNSSLEAYAQPTKIPHLWVLASGPTDEASPNLLYSSDLDAVLRNFARRFDLTFIDTPPMQLYADARVLGQLSDGVVMVVRANTRSSQELRAAYQKLLQDRIRVLGTVLNDWKMGRDQARKYTRYYQYYQRHEGDAG